MANPTTNYGFVLPTPTDLVTDLPADFDVALQGVDTQMLTNANAAIAKTIVDAKGDIIAATAADAVSRLAVGANDTVLTADSATATGLKWAASGGMTLLSTTTMSGSATTISSISGSYINLLLILDNYRWSTSNTYLTIKLNGSSAGNCFQVNTTGTTSFAAVSTGYAASDRFFPHYDNLVTSTQPVSMAMLFSRYATSDTIKAMTYSGLFYSTDRSELRAMSGGGGFSSTAAITSIEISNNAANNATAGTAYLYGVK